MVRIPQPERWSDVQNGVGMTKPIRDFITENSNSIGYGQWRTTLQNAGYFPVSLSSKEWSTVHNWCVDTFGDRYTWTGEVFWFETREDAMRFKLQWG